MRRIYLNEFNLMMGKGTYLPLVSGILRAYAEQSSIVNANYEFMPFHFHVGDARTIIDSHDAPAVVAFSVSMWNERLSLRVAEQVKSRFPKCLVIVGGAQAPHNAKPYFERYPFIDIVVRGEGEDAFRAILEQYVDGVDSFSEIPGVTWRDSDGNVHANEAERPFGRDLDIYPSPYLSGIYDDLMASRPDLSFQAIIETNRGCPFKCTFCYWGMGGLTRKYRFHSLERVRAELEWMAKHKIGYVFNADSNFGAHRRDEQIAQMLIELKTTYGYPEKFRTCYGKNTDDRIFQIGSKLHEHQLEKGITISYQSVDAQVQKNIKRDNIKLDVAEELQRRFNELNVPVYTEMILGLPGESMQTWKAGIDKVLDSGLKNQLFLYICEVLPNTDLADPGYQRLHGVVSLPIELTEIHVSPRAEGWVSEIEEIVVQTDTMPQEDWRKMLSFSWATMLFHSLKVAFYALAFMRKQYGVRYSSLIAWFAEGDFSTEKYPLLHRLHESMQAKCERILDGEGRGILAPKYGNIYWEQEEIMFFEISANVATFYDELYALALEKLSGEGVDIDAGLLRSVFDYQAARMPTADSGEVFERTFEYNLPEHFEHLFTTREVEVEAQRQVARVKPVDFQGDYDRFARETVLWKRKNGNFLNAVTWESS